MKRNMRILLIVLAVLAIAGGTLAFAAQNTVDASLAGDGLGAVTPYDVTDIVYTPIELIPDLLSKVEFSTDEIAVTVYVQLVDGGDWYICEAADGLAWSCDTTSPALSIEDINQLRVVATQ
jgi:hypothetical protein